MDFVLTPELYLTELSGLSIEEFWLAARADRAGLSKDELARILISIGAKYNYGQPPAASATKAQIAEFWRALQLQDLALAQACALGRDVAWQQFVNTFREPLRQAATAITGSSEAGRELADSLYAEMFGLTERRGERQSPLASYSGRGSLKGFLRTTLAQRNIDRHRRAYRETALTSNDFPAEPVTPIPESDGLARVGGALKDALRLLSPEEQFILSAWYLDQRTLLDISRVIDVHEATVSRRLQRLTTKLHEALLSNLEASGMSRAAAVEAAGVDPRDLDVNLRTLLQTSDSTAFPVQRLI